MLQVDNAILQRGVEVLKRGGLVAYPTDTLYGLGADGLDENAVRRVYVAKGRGQLKALPLLIDSVDALSIVATNVPQIALDLAARFWPGALTLVLKRSSSVPDAVTGGGDTVALRVPGHPVPRELARRSGSANYRHQRQSQRRPESRNIGRCPRPVGRCRGPGD